MANRDRQSLQTILEELLGSRNVYFQPPSTIRMKFPAIVYELNDIQNEHADNNVYCQNRSYQVTVIDANPDSEIKDHLSFLPYCRFSRHFCVDNLNHWVYILYY